jgi:hypothetical protein
MTTPEWTAVDQGLRSRRIALRALVTVLVALGILGGIGLGIPIGREQQARFDDRPVDTDEPQGWRSAEDSHDAMAPRLLPPAGEYSGGASHPHTSIDL